MSYSTVTEANEYVTTHYLSTDSLRKYWESLTDDDKQVLLNQAYSIINALPLSGCKTDPQQDGAFPRCGSTEVPVNVKYAEIELAVSMSDSDTMLALSEYRSQINYGISSYSIGNFSETVLSYAGNNLQLQYGLVSSEAKRLLLPWLNGGFRFE